MIKTPRSPWDLLRLTTPWPCLVNILYWRGGGSNLIASPSPDFAILAHRWPLRAPRGPDDRSRAVVLQVPRKCEELSRVSPASPMPSLARSKNPSASHRLAEGVGPAVR